MTLLAELTRNALRHRNPLIVDRLMRSDATLDAAEMLGARLGTQTWVAFKAVAQALARAPLDREFTVAGRDDQGSVTFKRTPAGVIICEGESAGAIIWELGLLDPEASIRLRALNEFAINARPSLPREQHWRSTVTMRPLSPLELDAFVGCVSNSAGLLLEKMAASLAQSNQITLRGLVPAGATYYESIVGPAPSPETSSREYLEAKLIPLQRTVLERDSTWGWFTAQAAYVGPSSDLKPVLNSLDAASVFALVQDFVPLSPLGYVAKFSALIARSSESPDCLARARSVLDELIVESQKSPTDQGAAALFPALIRLTLTSLSGDEETSHAPAYWRRLAAIAHANMLLHFMDFTGVELAGFETWVDTLRLSIGDIRNYADAWTEPSWYPDQDYFFTPWISAIGLAKKLCLDMSIADQVFDADLERRLDVPPGQAGFAGLVAHIPDVLQGRLRASDRADSTMDAEGEAALLSALANSDKNSALLVLLLNARLNRFSDRLRTAFIDWLQDLAEAHPRDTRQAIAFLSTAARIAAVQPDVEIANSVAQKAINLVGEDSPVDTCSLAWRCLMFAAGAIPDQAERLAWLEDRLFTLSRVVSKGTAAIDLAGRIELLQRLQPVTSRRFTRARYTALAAVS